jgi:hypothetical protein
MKISIKIWILTGAIPFCLAGSEPNTEVPKLSLPLQCTPAIDCVVQNYPDRDPGPAANDYTCGSQTYQSHTGTDFRLKDMRAQRNGVAVLAAASGRVLRVRDGLPDVSIKVGGAAAVAGLECGNGIVIDHGGGLTTQYCHMAFNSILVRTGDFVKRGQAIGQVGLSGQTEYPHLHFTVRVNNAPIDPFAPSRRQPTQCGSSETLWDAKASTVLSYRPAYILNFGFTSAPPTMQSIEEGTHTKASKGEDLLIAYLRIVNLKVGDVQRIKLTAPDGSTIASRLEPPLASNQAQRFVYVGKKRGKSDWQTGAYRTTYSVERRGRLILEKEFQLQF